MFPNGLPGKGLLLLRLAAGGLLVYNGIAGFSGSTPVIAVVRQLLEVGTGLLLIAGFLTPIAGGLVLIVELWIIFSGTDHVPIAIVLATLGSALAMLGPGAISIDAIRFGRKRIEIRDL